MKNLPSIKIFVNMFKIETIIKKFEIYWFFICYFSIVCTKPQPKLKETEFPSKTPFYQ